MTRILVWTLTLAVVLPSVAVSLDNEDPVVIPELDHPYAEFFPPLSESLSPTKYDELLRFAEATNPAVYRALQAYKLAEGRRPVAGTAPERLLQDLVVQRHFLERTKERDPEFYEEIQKRIDLESQVDEIVLRYHQATEDEQRAAARDELRPLLERLFDLREAEKQHEIERLQEEIERLQRQLQVRRENRDRIIDRHLHERLGEPDILRW